MQEQWLGNGAGQMGSLLAVDGVVEYELTGTVTTTRVQATAPFIGVLRVRDGQIAQWREYQDQTAIALALAQPT